MRRDRIGSTQVVRTGGTATRHHVEHSAVDLAGIEEREDVGVLPVLRQHREAEPYGVHAHTFIE